MSEKQREEDREKALKELRDIIKRYGLEFIADRYLEIKYRGYWFSLSEIMHGAEGDE